MKPDSVIKIHLGVNLVIAPFPSINQTSSIAFQQSIVTHGLEYQKVINEENKLVLIREKPTPLQITLGLVNAPNIGQMIIIAPNPNRPINVFINEAETVAQAFLSVWNAPYQVLASDTSIKELHETSTDHAFQEIWEERLKQPHDSLLFFDRPVRAGGLRFILDPKSGEENPVRIEVKIESLIDNSKKISIETQFFYLRPPPGSGFDIGKRIEDTNSYVTNQVYNFLKGKIDDVE
jgi:hypothetical protein